VWRKADEVVGEFILILVEDIFLIPLERWERVRDFIYRTMKGIVPFSKLFVRICVDYVCNYRFDVLIRPAPSVSEYIVERIWGGRVQV